jgi:hypothetical protein
VSVDIIKARGPNGEQVTFFICSRGNRRRAPPCCSCQKPSTLLCDYPLQGKAQGRTCSRPLCDACTVRGAATHLGALGSGHREIDTFDLCPTHARVAESKQP